MIPAIADLALFHVKTCETIDGELGWIYIKEFTNLLFYNAIIEF